MSNGTNEDEWEKQRALRARISEQIQASTSVQELDAVGDELARLIENQRLTMNQAVTLVREITQKIKALGRRSSVQFPCLRAFYPLA
jgi:Tfp pilus assembly PilM family ATPase